MKNVCSVLFALAFCFVAMQPAYGQIKLGKLLKEAMGVEESTESNDDSEVEVEIESADQVTAVKNEQPISFVMEIEEFKKGKSKGKSLVKMTLDNWKTAIQTSDAAGESTALMIFDNKKGTVLTITDADGERSGVEIKQPKVRVRGGSADDYEVNRTGETKTIDGAVCEKYIITHKDGTTTSWVTDDYGIIYGEMIAPLFSRMKNSPQQMEELNEMEGIPIESRTISKDGKTETVMFVKDIKKDAAIDRSVFEVDDVKVMSLNFGF